MLTKISSAADRMTGSWIVAAVLLALLAVASATAEGSSTVAGVSEGGLAAADVPAQSAPLAAPSAAPLVPASIPAGEETIVAIVEADGFMPPEN